MNFLEKLNGSERERVIAYFYKAYYDTDLDESVFTKEFFFLVGEILQNKMPESIKCITGWEDGFFELLKDINAQR